MQETISPTSIPSLQQTTMDASEEGADYNNKHITQDRHMDTDTGDMDIHHKHNKEDNILKMSTEIPTQTDPNQIQIQLHDTSGEQIEVTKGMFVVVVLLCECCLLLDTITVYIHVLNVLHVRVLFTVIVIVC